MARLGIARRHEPTPEATLACAGALWRAGRNRCARRTSELVELGEKVNIMEIGVRKLCTNDFDPLFELVQQFASSFRPERAAFTDAAHVLVAQEDAWLGGAEDS